MSVTTTNLLQGPSTIYRGIVGATEPADTTLNTAPSTGWTDLGATLDGVDLGVYETYAMLEADQLIEHASAVRTAREFRFGTKLAEPTLANLAIAINDAAPTTGTSPAGPTLEPISGLNNLPIFSAFIIDGYAPGGFKRRIILRRALQTSDVKMSQSKKDQTALSVEFTTLYVSASIKPFRIVDGIA
jgi:hypothetical protein